MENIFIDTNILIYATDKNNQFYLVAFEKLKQLSQENKLFISGQILREYAKVKTQQGNLSHQEIINNIKLFQDNYTVLYDNNETTKELLYLIITHSVKGKSIYDCNIAATMKHYKIKKLLTNNVKDFVKYKSFTEIIPLIETNN